MSTSQQPLAQLESLKYRTTQIMESITSLQYLIDANGQPMMPSWPDILAKYNFLLSQTHSLSVSLSSALASHQGSQSQYMASASAQNPFQKLALHPSVSIPEQQLDHALAPLLRNQPTPQVIKEEDTSVRRIAAISKTEASDGLEQFDQIVRECTEIRRAHDARVERAVKAVALLRDRYEWHARVEPEDLDKTQDDDEDEDDREHVGQDDTLGDSNEDGPRDENVTVRKPDVLVVVKGENTTSAENHLVSEAAEAKEAQEAEDVLGQGIMPG